MASQSSESQTTLYQCLDEVWVNVMTQLEDFTFDTSKVPRCRYSIPRVIRALMEHPPDTIGLAQHLWKALDKRSVGEAWLDYWASLDVEIDDQTSLPLRARMDQAGLNEMIDRIKNNSNAQYALFRWADEFFVNFFQPMRQRSRTGTPSKGSSSSATPTSNFRRSLFKRDGPACLVTGTIHERRSAADYKKWNENYAKPNDGDHESGLEGAHIIPLSIAERKATYPLFTLFSGGTITSEIINNRINSPENGLMMEPSPHSAFYGFRWGIECSDVPNSNVPDYRINIVAPRVPVTLDGRDRRQLPFGLWERSQRNDPEAQGSNLTPLPNPEFLRIHLALARVLHASGAGKIVNQIYWEEEEMKLYGGNLPNFSEMESEECDSDVPSREAALSYIDRKLGGLENNDFHTP